MVLLLWRQLRLLHESGGDDPRALIGRLPVRVDGQSLRGASSETGHICPVSLFKVQTSSPHNVSFI